MSDKISKFESAGMAKRLWANLMDGALFVFAYFIIAMWIFTPLANVFFDYNSKNELGNQYKFASHLTVNQKRNDDGVLEIVEVKDSTGDYKQYISVNLYNYEKDSPSFYINSIYYYYHNYKTNTDIELPKNSEEKTFEPIADHYTSPEYNVEINGELPVNLYTNDWFGKEILNINDESSYFKIDETKPTYLESIILKDENKLDDALKFLRNAAYDAMSDLYHSHYFESLNNEIQAIQLFIFMPPFAISFGIFFLLIPLLMKDGQTLGKKVTHVAVISFDGYAAKKRQIILRELLLFFALFAGAFVFGIGITSFAILGLVVVILFGITLIPKNKRAPHDYAAYTIVIDTIHSTWFKNKEDEERHQRQLEDNMSKYRKVIPNQENIIQIGDQIVDKEFKKKFLEEQEKEKSQNK